MTGRVRGASPVRVASTAAGPAAAAATRWGRAALPAVVAAGVVALAAAAAFSGAFGRPALADPGPLVRGAAPVVTMLGHLAAALTAGALLLVVTIAPGRAPNPATRAATSLAGGAAAAWTLLAAARLVLDYSVLSGEPPTSPTFGAQLGLFVTQVTIGRYLLTVTILAALCSTLALAVTRPAGAALTLAVAALALGLLAQTGHAAGSVSHDAAVSAMALHLAGVVVWVGGLAALALLSRRLGDGLPVAARRFSALALWAFLAVAVSGVVAAAIRLGSPAGLATPYGALVLVKASALGLLGVAGLLHRRRTLPALARGDAGGENRARAAFRRLVVVELGVMAATVGTAVALAGSEPPVPQVPFAEPTPVEAVTGYTTPPLPEGAAWLTVWRPDLVFSLAALVLGVGYVRWVVRLRRRGDAWPAGRTVAWLAGVAVLAWATNGAPSVYGLVLFSAHMLEHMVLATVTPVLFVLAAPVTLALRALPARKDGSRGPREWLLAVLDTRFARVVAHPLVAALGFAGSMVVFYTTPLFALALTSHLGHVAMVVHFSLVGYLFVNALIGVDPGPQRPSYPFRLVLLLATMAFHAFFGVALAQSTILLAADWYGALGLEWRVDALADQQQGANLAWAVGELPTLVIAAVVAARWARADERAAARSDRAAERDGDAELAAYNAMLARLAGAGSPAEPPRPGGGGTAGG